MTDADFPAAHSMDTSWYAVDADGCVALFSTGKVGHAPVGYESAYYMEDLYEARHPQRPDQFHWEGDDRAAAEVGIFLYDYSEAWEPIQAYDRRVVPPDPVHVDQLPPAIRLGCKRIQLSGIRFADAARVQPIELFPCDYSGGEERVAFVAADGITVRPVPGKERRFADFVRRFRAESPDAAARYHFEGITNGT
jgi:hypothetical protein